MSVLRVASLASLILAAGCVSDGYAYAPSYPPGYDSGMGSGQYVQQGDLFGGQDVADVRAFYEPLAPYGAWVDSQFGYAFQPRVDQAWRPYVNGRWGENRLWLSDDPWGWATDHYGRWGYDQRIGWVWVPGTQWAPSWVAWREDEQQDVAGWAPIPPGVAYSFGVGFASALAYDNYASWYAPSWVWVPRRNLYAPGFGGGVLPWRYGQNYWGNSHWNHNSGWQGKPGYGRPGYGRPGYGTPSGRPPNAGRPPANGNWNGRPPAGYSGDGRPTGGTNWNGRPPGSTSGDGRPSGGYTGNGRPPGTNGDGRPSGGYSGNGRPPGTSGDGRPSGGHNGNGRPPGGQWQGRPPGEQTQGRPPGGQWQGRPPGSAAGTPPGQQRPNGGRPAYGGRGNGQTNVQSNVQGGRPAGTAAAPAGGRPVTVAAPAPRASRPPPPSTARQRDNAESGNERPQ
jgi:hypothetical protein